MTEVTTAPARESQKSKSIVIKVQVAPLKVVRVLLPRTLDRLGQTHRSLWACIHLFDAACHAIRT